MLCRNPCPVAAVYLSSVALAKDDDRRTALTERRYSFPHHA